MNLAIILLSRLDNKLSIINITPVDAAIADGDNDEVAADTQQDSQPEGVQHRKAQHAEGQGLAMREVLVEILQIVVKLMAPSTTF